MSDLDFDANGWAIGAVAPLPVEEAWLLLAPEPSARVDAALWAHKADAFFRARLEVVQAKRYPAGTCPIADRLQVDVGRRGEAASARVLVVTVPIDRAPEAKAAAIAGASAIGGAGFDALIPRARRLWQVRATPEEGGDARGPLVLAAVLASVLLAPVVPPGGGTIFGVKGARERLAAAGWRT